MTDYQDLVARLTEINADSKYSDEAHWSGEAATAIETLRRERDEAFQKYVDANEARIDVDALRALLREARNQLITLNAIDATIARIDAALKGGDE